jgi:hypothetical protein
MKYVCLYAPTTPAGHGWRRRCSSGRLRDQRREFGEETPGLTGAVITVYYTFDRYSSSQ